MPPILQVVFYKGDRRWAAPHGLVGRIGGPRTGAVHEIGLVNRRVETRSIKGGDGLLAKVALKPFMAAVGIVSVGCDPVSGKVTLTLDDGRTLSLTAGQHIEEAEEW